MKNYILKICLLSIFLLNNFALLAQPTDVTTDVEDTGTPINAGLIWLGIAGVVFAFYFFRNRTKTA